MKILSPSQCRAARGLLNWSQEDLAKRTGLHKQTISNFEAERSTPSKSSLENISYTLETGGVELIDMDGTKRKTFGSRILKGRSGLYEMYEDYYKTIAVDKDFRDFWLYNGISYVVADALGEGYREMHVERMIPYLDKLHMRVVIKQGDDIYWGSDYAYYRWISNKYFNDKTIYVYGSRVALIDFNNEITINLIDSDEFADTQRLFLSTIWETKAFEPKTTKKFQPD